MAHIVETPGSFPLSPAFVAGQEVHVWHVAVSRVRSRLAEWYSILRSEEQQQANRFVFPGDRERYIAAHGALWELVNAYREQPRDEFVIGRTAYGKPFLPGSKVRFNLSHSGDAVLIGFARNRHVGVDIEQGRPRMEWAQLVHRYFSPPEIAEFDQLPRHEQPAAFLRCWTRKEAYVKARGLGLSLSLESFAVPLGKACQAHRLCAGDDTDWVLQALENLPYPAAVVYQGHVCPVMVYSFGERVRVTGEAEMPAAI